MYKCSHTFIALQVTSYIGSLGLEKLAWKMTAVAQKSPSSKFLTWKGGRMAKPFKENLPNTG